jgi:hypothetical protein
MIEISIPANAGAKAEALEATSHVVRCDGKDTKEAIGTRACGDRIAKTAW